MAVRTFQQQACRRAFLPLRLFCVLQDKPAVTGAAYRIGKQSVLYPVFLPLRYTHMKMTKQVQETLPWAHGNLFVSRLIISRDPGAG